MPKKVIRFTPGAVLSALCFFLALSFPAQAQQTGKVHRIGYLDSGTSSGGAVMLDAFRQEMGKLGWIEGKNINIEHRFSEGKGPDRLAELAAELIRLKVDVIVGTVTGPALAAKRATSTIPIVTVNAGNPVAAGLVASLARPGGNVTGLSGLTPELSAKRLEILKEVVPRLTRVGVLLGERGAAGQELQLKEIRAAAVVLEVKLDEIRTNFDAKGLESTFQAAVQRQIKGIISPSTRNIFAARKRIVELVGKYRLPAIYFQKEFVGEGGLMFYGTDLRDQYRRVATYVDKILKGAKPADLPVEQPTKFEFIINLKAAKQIGLTIPPNVLARANKVIR